MAEQTVAKSLFVLFADIPTSRWIELTLIDEKLNNGDEVTVVYCDGVLPACTINHNADRSICNACIGRTRYHLGLLKKLSDVHSLSEYVTEDAIHQVGEISSAVFLKNLNEPCERFGYGPLSSAVSFTRDMNFSIDSTIIVRHCVSGLHYQSYSAHLHLTLCTSITVDSQNTKQPICY